MKVLLSTLLTLLLASAELLAQNVGIGTAAPAQKLEVVGNVRVSSLAGTGSRLVFANANGDLTTAGPTPSAFWSTTGNAGTAAGTNFVGTTNFRDLVFRTNNVVRGRFESAGEFVVNNPTAVGGDEISGWNLGAGNGVVGVTNGTGNGIFAISLAPGNAITGQASGTGRALLGFTAAASPLPTLQAQNEDGTGLTAYFLKNANSPAPVLQIDNTAGTGIGLGVVQNVAATALVINQNGNNRAAEIALGAAVTDVVGVGIFNDGVGRSLTVQQDRPTNIVPALFASNLHDGTNANATAVFGQNENGVRGATFIAGRADNASIGVQGQAGLASTDNNHVGVFGLSTGNPGFGFGVIGDGDAFGVFSIGDVGASGGKPFMIDHPADPEHKFLRHFAMESDEVLNYYRGKVELDTKGEAIVELPDYVELVGRDFTYSLTPIGAAMPNLYIANEIDGGQFKIAGGEAGKTVSWNITGERNDPYYAKQPEKREVVIQKDGSRVGRYFHPELYDQPEEKGYFNGIGYTREELEQNNQQPQQHNLENNTRGLAIPAQDAQERAERYQNANTVSPTR